MKKQLQGISLMLFGLLLGIAEGDLNHFITLHFSSFPFSLVSLIFCIVGLAFIFKPEKDK